MTGAERLAQVREYMDEFDGWEKDNPENPLGGCVLLTAEEAAHIDRTLIRVQGDDHYHRVRHARALLTPNQEQTDEEFIAEQTGGPC